MLPIMKQADQALEWLMGQGFVLLAVGLMNAAALAVALVQVGQARKAARNAKSEAVLSKESAQQAWEALSQQLYQVALADAASHATQIEHAIAQGDWQFARVRASDLRAALARMSPSLPARIRTLLLGEDGLLGIVYGQIAERCKDPEYIITEELEKGLAVISTELNSLLGKKTHRQGGASA